MNKRRKCIVVSAGDFVPENLHREQGDIIIAADNGLWYLSGMGIEPDYVIGDYDSLCDEAKEALASFEREHPERLRRLPEEKDDTDTVAAVRWGLELGFLDFRLYGALGGRRVDHTISNLQTLLFIAERGGRGAILDERQVLFLIEDRCVRFRKGLSGLFSLFALDSAVTVTIRGMKYECEKLTVTWDYPIGCSNQFLPETAAVVEVRGGMALAVAERRKPE